jgi:hypothetical protein
LTGRTIFAPPTRFGPPEPPKQAGATLALCPVNRQLHEHIRSGTARCGRRVHARRPRSPLTAVFGGGKAVRVHHSRPPREVARHADVINGDFRNPREDSQQRKAARKMAKLLVAPAPTPHDVARHLRWPAAACASDRTVYTDRRGAGREPSSARVFLGGNGVNLSITIGCERERSCRNGPSVGS